MTDEARGKRYRSDIWCTDPDCDCFCGGVEQKYHDTLDEAHKDYNRIFDVPPWDGAIYENINGEWKSISPPEGEP